MTARLLCAGLAVVLASCAIAPEPRQATPAPASLPSPQMAATAHPLASRAALDMLDKGGTPVDAAIAAQMVLGLVEPQSSGLGGGSVLMVWDAAAQKLASYDGLASAPSRTTASLRTDTDGSRLPDLATRGGRSVGIPGTLPVLKLAHDRHGKLPWRDLFAPAIALAESGFPMPPYLHRILSRPDARAVYAEMENLYFGADGKAFPVGTTIRNAEYARTLRRVAARGPEGLLAEGGAERIVAASQRGYRPSLMTTGDLADYRAVEREPVCAPFVAYRVCTMAPPSFGGLKVLQILQMVEFRARGRFDFDDPAFAHLYAEAGKLAHADRMRYGDDPGYAGVATRELASTGYARSRAATIDLQRANPDPRPGNPSAAIAAAANDEGEGAEMTSQVAIVDKAGNALAMTTTINLDFGARLQVDGFALNNAMVVFAEPRDGVPAPANRMAPGKRPVTYMAPTIAFDAQGHPVVVGGSAGGNVIPDYIAASLIDMLGNGLTPAEALARGHIGTGTPRRILLESGTKAAALAPALRAAGHDVDVTTLLSGLAFLKREASGWIGAADPRRDGEAMGR